MIFLKNIIFRLKERFAELQDTTLKSWPMYEELRSVEKELRRNDGIISQDGESVLKTK